jgi:hypothetical protein
MNKRSFWKATQSLLAEFVQHAVAYASAYGLLYGAAYVLTAMGVTGAMALTGPIGMFLVVPIVAWGWHMYRCVGPDSAALL